MPNQGVTSCFLSAEHASKGGWGRYEYANCVLFTMEEHNVQCFYDLLAPNSLTGTVTNSVPATGTDVKLAEFLVRWLRPLTFAKW